MAATPVLDERRLKKALTEQGFRLTPTSKGVRVLAPDGEGTAMIHPSVFKSQQGRRAYRNNLAQLARIGFDLNKVDIGGNGRADEWKEDRVEVEKLIAEANEKAAAEAEVLPDVTEDVELRSKIRNLSPPAKELYDLIAERPGLKPSQYAGHLGWERQNLNNHGQVLQREGLIEATGATQSRRYWIAGQIDFSKVQRSDRPSQGRMFQGGRPSAGPVRIRSIDSADPVVRFKRMGEKAMRLKSDLEEIITAMVSQYEAQEEERKRLRMKVDKLETILGRAVDAL